MIGAKNKDNKTKYNKHRPPEGWTVHWSSSLPWKAFPTTLGIPHFTYSLIYCVFPETSSLTTTWPVFSLLTQSIFLQNAYFSLYGICLLSVSPNSWELNMLCCAHAHLPRILNITGHRVRSELLFKEIYLTPRDTKNLSSAFRKGHSPNGFSPWSQTVSSRKQRRVRSVAGCPPRLLSPAVVLHQLECSAGEVPGTTLQL